MIIGLSKMKVIGSFDKCGFSGMVGKISSLNHFSSRADGWEEMICIDFFPGFFQREAWRLNKGMVKLEYFFCLKMEKVIAYWYINWNDEIKRKNNERERRTEWGNSLNRWERIGGWDLTSLINVCTVYVHWPGQQAECVGTNAGRLVVLAVSADGRSFLNASIFLSEISKSHEWGQWIYKKS